jgi:hypothetical protein
MHVCNGRDNMGGSWDVRMLRLVFKLLKSGFRHSTGTLAVVSTLYGMFSGACTHNHGPPHSPHSLIAFLRARSLHLLASFPGPQPRRSRVRVCVSIETGSLNNIPSQVPAPGLLWHLVVSGASGLRQSRVHCSPESFSGFVPSRSPLYVVDSRLLNGSVDSPVSSLVHRDCLGLLLRMCDSADAPPASSDALSTVGIGTR